MLESEPKIRQMTLEEALAEVTQVVVPTRLTPHEVLAPLIKWSNEKKAQIDKDPEPPYWAR